MKFADDKWERFSNKDEPQRMSKGLFEMKDIHSTRIDYRQAAQAMEGTP